MIAGEFGELVLEVVLDARPIYLRGGRARPWRWMGRDERKGDEGEESDQTTDEKRSKKATKIRQGRVRRPAPPIVPIGSPKGEET